MEYNFLEFDQIDSTNMEAIRLAKTQPSGNFVIWAKSQNAGHGTYGRSWHSPIGNLYASLLLNNNITVNQQPQLSFVVAIAIYDLIKDLASQSQTELNIKLKWPNDVLINEKKVSGILLEAISLVKKNYLIIGVGINLNTCPDGMNRPVTSLSIELLTKLDVNEVLSLFLNYFNHYFSLWARVGFLNIREIWLERAYGLNKSITINDGRNNISGIFKDIGPTGEIKIEVAGGNLLSFLAGEFLP